MGLFSRINTSEYNDKLEKILETKNFSNETKNLLLSMLYKVENSYEDYHKVKTETDSKEEFIRQLLYIIQNECESIITIVPESDENNNLSQLGKNCIINAPEGKITVYENEKDLLYAIFALHTEYNQYRDMKEFNVDNLSYENKLILDAVKDFLVKGEAMDTSEIIRDFNGWSWNTDNQSIENIEINLIYQNIILLLGNNIKKSFLLPEEEKKDTLNMETNAEDLRIINDLHDEKAEKNIQEKIDNYLNVIQRAFTKVYFKEKVENIINYINVIILSISARQNSNVESKLVEILDEKKNRVSIMEDKHAFLNTITQEKKDINSKIRKMDITLNNKDLLEKEYEKRNSKLEDKDKIFSISHLVKMLEKEREDLLNSLREKNQILEPACYISEKDKLEKERDFLTQVIANCKKSNEYESLKNIQMEFIKCFMIQVEQADTKDELIDLLYKFRYYCLLPITESQAIKDVPELDKGIKDIIDTLIDKCIDKKIIENISNSVSLCYNTIKYIFESRITDLEKINIKIKKEKEEIINSEKKEKKYYITITLYDSKEEEEEHKTTVNNLLLLNVKLNKKIQLFI